jgi:hypothetical protein
MIYVTAAVCTYAVGYALGSLPCYSACNYGMEAEGPYLFVEFMETAVGSPYSTLATGISRESIESICTGTVCCRTMNAFLFFS